MFFSWIVNIASYKIIQMTNENASLSYLWMHLPPWRESPLAPFAAETQTCGAAERPLLPTSLYQPARPGQPGLSQVLSQDHVLARVWEGFSNFSFKYQQIFINCF